MPKFVVLVAKIPRRCPRCKTYGLFRYPGIKTKKYGPRNFYCETCDPGHQQPIRLPSAKKRSKP